MKRLTIKDVAKAANVSSTTVSRALSGSPEIGEATRKRIVEICDKMGYAPNAVARSLVNKATMTLGFIVNNISSPYTSEVAYYVEEQAWSHGYSLILCNSGSNPDKEEAAFKLLVGRQVDGILMQPFSQQTYPRLAPYLASVPTVFLHDVIPTESYVTIDDHKGTYMGTEYLHSLGHRNIVYFGRRGHKESRRLRAQGYADACKNFGLTPRFVDYIPAITTPHQGIALAREMFSRPLDFTAVFANNDSQALNVMRAADECGIRIPEDLSLLGFDNISYAGLPKINLTTIEQPKQTVAAAAVNMLVEKIRYPSTQPSHRIVTPSLVIRESCQPIDPPMQSAI